MSGLSGARISRSTQRPPPQHGIIDLDKAPTDAEGLVHFTGDFVILKPVDPARGNRRLFFDYGNRGNKRMLQFFNDAPAATTRALWRMPATVS